MFYTLLHQFILKYFEQNNASNCFCNILNTIDVFFVPIMMESYRNFTRCHGMLQNLPLKNREAIGNNGNMFDSSIYKEMPVKAQS